MKSEQRTLLILMGLEQIPCKSRRENVVNISAIQIEVQGHGVAQQVRFVNKGGSWPMFLMVSSAQCCGVSKKLKHHT